MDFILALPKSEGCGRIMVVVDRYSKYATFIATPTDCKADEAADLFIKHIIKLWRVPKSIVSDRDPCFTGRFWTEFFKMLGTDLKFSTSFHPQTDGQTERFTRRFWTELFKMLGTNLKFSTSFHPQTDGQTERINSLLEMYLRHYMSAHQRD